ncbi:MAG TPA: hypothetical protein VJ750_13310 [Rhizomicrobium sp.]|nr:hypothetical protein [Rhizomicrobium sp.]
MRRFDLLAALALAAVLFIVFKVLGLVVKLALGAALIGFVAGLIGARLLRRS